MVGSDSPSFSPLARPFVPGIAALLQERFAASVRNRQPVGSSTLSADAVPYSPISQTSLPDIVPQSLESCSQYIWTSAVLSLPFKPIAAAWVGGGAHLVLAAEYGGGLAVFENVGRPPQEGRFLSTYPILSFEDKGIDRWVALRSSSADPSGVVVVSTTAVGYCCLDEGAERETPVKVSWLPLISPSGGDESNVVARAWPTLGSRRSRLANSVIVAASPAFSTYIVVATAGDSNMLAFHVVDYCRVKTLHSLILTTEESLGNVTCSAISEDLINNGSLVVFGTSRGLGILLTVGLHGTFRQDKLIRIFDERPVVSACLTSSFIVAIQPTIDGDNNNTMAGQLTVINHNVNGSITPEMDELNVWHNSTVTRPSPSIADLGLVPHTWASFVEQESQRKVQLPPLVRLLRIDQNVAAIAQDGTILLMQVNSRFPPFMLAQLTTSVLASSSNNTSPVLVSQFALMPTNSSGSPGSVGFSAQAMMLGAALTNTGSLYVATSSYYGRKLMAEGLNFWDNDLSDMSAAESLTSYCNVLQPQLDSTSIPVSSPWPSLSSRVRANAYKFAGLDPAMLSAWLVRRPPWQYRDISENTAVEAIRMVIREVTRGVSSNSILQTCLEETVIEEGRSPIIRFSPIRIAAWRRDASYLGGKAAAVLLDEEMRDRQSTPVKVVIDGESLKLLLHDTDGSLSLFNETSFVCLEGRGEYNLIGAVVVALMTFSRLKDEVVTHFCAKEVCVACELGLLWHMMGLAAQEGLGIPCRAKNLLSTFKRLPEARQCRFIDNNSGTIVDPPRQAPQFMQFLLEHLRRELDSTGQRRSIVGNTFAFETQISSCCGAGHITRSTHSSRYMLNLYQTHETTSSTTSLGSSNSSSYAADSIPTLIQHVLTRKFYRKGHCASCRKNTRLEHIETPLRVPPALILNCQDAHIEGPIPAELWIADELENIGNNSLGWVTTAQSNTYRGNRYVLHTVVSEIREDWPVVCDLEPMFHLVTHIRYESLSKSTSACKKLFQFEHSSSEPWITFNGFIVTTEKDHIVRSTDVDWRRCCLLIYIAVNGEAITSPSLETGGKVKILKRTASSIPRQVVLSHHNLSQNPAAPSSPNFLFEPLSLHEILRIETEGMLLAIDAEFVAMNHAAAEENKSAYGDSVAELGFARLSIVRAEGDKKFVPCLDVHILASQEPANYLTRFSGLRPGDLSERGCLYWLTTRKQVYQKLRFLVDHGCTFIGHGLNKDLAIINLYVPRRQLIDTVQLFRLPGRRMISLRFLARHILHCSVQGSSDGHDSVEDAVVAVKLYDRYRDLVSRNMLRPFLNYLYCIGTRLNWNVSENRVPTSVLYYSHSACIIPAGSSETYLSGSRGRLGLYQNTNSYMRGNVLRGNVVRGNVVRGQMDDEDLPFPDIISGYNNNSILLRRRQPPPMYSPGPSLHYRAEEQRGGLLVPFGSSYSNGDIIIGTPTSQQHSSLQQLPGPNSPQSPHIQQSGQQEEERLLWQIRQAQAKAAARQRSA